MATPHRAERRRPVALMGVIGVVVLALAIALGVGRWRTTDRPGAPTSDASARVPAVRAEAEAGALLSAWDGRRARAWARGDPVALAALYAPGSSAGRRDVAMLGRWAERGLRVRDLRMQLLDLDVVERTPTRLDLLVTDRVAGGRAVGAGVTAPLPDDAASTRRLLLVRDAGEWRVASVRPR